MLLASLETTVMSLTRNARFHIIILIFTLWKRLLQWRSEKSVPQKIQKDAFLQVCGIKNSATDPEDFQDFLGVLLCTTISDKMFKIKYINLVKLDRTRKLWHLILQTFCLVLSIGKKTGRETRSPVKFEIFLIFSNFLRFLGYSATSKATRITSLLYYISRFVLLVPNWTRTKTL